MRIQNNIMALNTHRQYTINNDNVAKSAEKLSSGYKINRAGDDAAGLAISEKMRSQIRGLNMATKNSQDAISLVQTAEGALQETHSMLQRMNELANQSATGTNQSIDRNALAKEFDQLKREINDVAEQTTFNNMKILDGSLSYAGMQRSAATSGIVATTVDTPIATPAISGGVSTAYQAATKTVMEFDLKDMASTLVAGDTLELTFNDGAAVTITSNAAAGAIANGTDAAALFNGVTNTNYNIAVDGSKVTITAKADATADVTLTGGAVAAAAGATGTLTGTLGTSMVGGKAAIAEVTTAKIDVSKLAIGDTLQIDGQTIELVAAGNTAGAGRIGVEWPPAAGTTVSDLVNSINAAATFTNVTVAANGNNMTVTQNTPNVGKTDVKYSTLADKQTTIEFDIAKLKAGDLVRVDTAGKSYSYTFQDGDTVATIAAGLKDINGNTMAASVKGSAIIMNGTATVDNFQPRTEAADSYNAIRIQVGALEGEQLAVSIDAMNTKGLGLDGVSIFTQETAGKAITATRDAINKVSDQRASLGAMQNRLDHKIANLKVSSENLSAAESRIRDVDIASEMTAFTKSNILAQAATAMLAQANSLPQNVLSLLR